MFDLWSKLSQGGQRDKNEVGKGSTDKDTRNACVKSSDFEKKTWIQSLKSSSVLDEGQAIQLLEDQDVGELLQQTVACIVEAYEKKDETLKANILIGVAVIKAHYFESIALSEFKACLGHIAEAGDIELIKLFNWQWFWCLKPDNARSKNILARGMNDYLRSYVRPILAKMCAPKETKDSHPLENHACHSEVLDYLLPRISSSDVKIFRHHASQVDLLSVITEETDHIRSHLESLDIKWYLPKPNKLDSYRRSVIVNLANEYLVNECGLYEEDTLDWFVRIRENANIRSQMNARALALKQEIIASAASSGDKYVKRMSLAKVCPGLGIKPWRFIQYWHYLRRVFRLRSGHAYRSLNNRDVQEQLLGGDVGVSSSQQSIEHCARSAGSSL